MYWNPSEDLERLEVKKETFYSYYYPNIIPNLLIYVHFIMYKTCNIYELFNVDKNNES